MSVGKVLGFTKGIVIDTEDPAGYKRVRVRIPELHGTITTDFYDSHRNATRFKTVNRVEDNAIPWAEVNYPYGSDITPQRNQIVLVGFISGDTEKPVVLGWLGYEYTDDESDKKLQPLTT